MSGRNHSAAATRAEELLMRAPPMLQRPVALTLGRRVLSAHLVSKGHHLHLGGHDQARGMTMAVQHDLRPAHLGQRLVLGP